ncbi:hypothetical protein [Pseudobacteriovorax antillogorgiicola]|uniref:Uncharacterized protein n=1 Tax=Pseudobacteriovorax antillogorgiicola TaxID=1513793 RepID=A0A1Y6B365_9BACT|nr:hypothetical protein [Pseudobacteriovorax antillogorgiicola]TCS59353.1 hypothetical protein EDD56_101262 [Pseudobacteriovorax antillogorgiicola]SME89091.1 hypothetical protein SAMN06296036_101224 [Pseudobacteriovorax antillogorgiicola]
MTTIPLEAWLSLLGLLVLPFSVRASVRQRFLWLVTSSLAFIAVFLEQDILRLLVIDLLALGMMFGSIEASHRRVEALIKFQIFQSLGTLILISHILSFNLLSDPARDLLLILGLALKLGLFPMHRAWVDHMDASSPLVGLWFSFVYRLCWIFSLLNTGVSFVPGLWLGMMTLFVSALLILPQSNLNRAQAYLNLFVTGLLGIALGLFFPQQSALAPILLALASFPKSCLPDADGFLSFDHRGSLSQRQGLGLWAIVIVPIAVSLYTIEAAGQAASINQTIVINGLIILASFPLIYRTSKIYWLLKP